MYIAECQSILFLAKIKPFVMWLEVVRKGSCTHRVNLLI
jgi:hypothetical protein